MKKLLTVTLIVLLSLCLLWGCNNNTDADKPAAQTLYYNLDKGAELTAEGGVYTVNFYDGSEIKALKVTDEALLKTLLLQDFVGLTLDGDTVAGITLISDMPYQRITWDCYLQSKGGNTYKFNSYENFTGTEVLLKLEEGFPVYDFSPLAKEPGAATELLRNDVVSVIGDMEGNPLFAYVTNRAAVLAEEKAPCQHCESDVQWFEWHSTNSLPVGGGHFKLMNDIELASGAMISSSVQCLDLNGKTVTVSAPATRIYTLAGTGTLTILDTAGGGKFIPSSHQPGPVSGDYRGMIISCETMEFTVNLYGGTLDASDCISKYGVAVRMLQGTFNMYGGEILGGHSYGNGGGAMSITHGTVNIHGGRIAGGSLKTEEWGNNTPCGATIRCNGTLNIYDGIIEGGDSFTEGGAISVGMDIAVGSVGKLNMYGGTVTGGKAGTMGSGIYVSHNSTVTLSGNVKIIGNEGNNLWLDQEAKLYIGEDGLGEEARIGISMTNPGEFLSNVPADVDITKYFTSDDTSKKIVSTGDGSWGLKKIFP